MGQNSEGANDVCRLPDRPEMTLPEVMHDLGRAIHLEVLACVAIGPRRVTAISDDLELANSAVSKSLRRLKEHGLVHAVHEKNNHIYRVEPRFVTMVGGAHGAMRIGLVCSCGGRIDLAIPLESLPAVQRAMLGGTWVTRETPRHRHGRSEVGPSTAVASRSSDATEEDGRGHTTQSTDIVLPRTLTSAAEPASAPPESSP